MSKQKIKIGFSDFWYGFDPTNDNIFNKLLTKYYDVIYDNKNPDILFFSINGNEHKNFKCKKILFTPENFFCHKYETFDFELGEKNLFKYADYSITSFDLKNENNFRMLCYIRRYGYDIKKDIINRKVPLKNKKILFLQKNCVPFRDNFVKKLQKYIDVDCPGTCNKNLHIHIDDKLKFLEDYKFLISFENSSYPNYNTEKLIDGYISKSLPIYWGDTNVDKDFNPDTFLNYHKFKDEEELIERILYLNSHEEELNFMLSQNPILNESLFDENEFINFLNRIF